VDEDPPELPADSFSAEARDFVAQCLVKRVEDRPSAGVVLQHSFIERSKAAPMEAHVHWVQHMQATMVLTPTQVHEARGGDREARGGGAEGGMGGAGGAAGGGGAAEGAAGGSS